MKRLVFVGASLDDLSAFPAEARRVAGHELWQVQNGLIPSDFKPMRAVGAGAYEIRIHVLGEWRVIYVEKFEAAIYVLHAFQKKTQATSLSDIELARRRYREIQGESMRKTKMTKSSGNVFADLGFPPEEVTILTMRSDLMARLRLLIERKGWTQAQAAAELGISQSRVSDLVRGKWDKFSLDMLLVLATRAKLRPKLTLQLAS